MDELVKKIRHCATDPMHCLSCGEDKDGRCFKRLMTQAADAIEELSRENKEIMLRANQLEAMNDALIGETGAADALIVASKPRWIPVTERLPESGVHVLLSCKCGAGAYVCDGFQTEKYSTPTHFYEDIDADYNEDTDEYYFPEGWWEVIKNWDDYSCVAIEDKVTHWMPLPEPPEELIGTDMGGGIRRDEAGSVIDWGITGPPGDVGKTEEE